MNKKQFIAILRGELASMHESERDELIEDYETHFAFGLQSGKTEEQIVCELGDPFEISRSAMEDRGFSQPLKVSKGTEVPRTIFSVTALVLLNLMIMIPVGAAVWSVWVAVAAASAALLLSPLAALIDGIVFSFQGAKLFASIAFCGVGAFAGIGAYYLFFALRRISLIYTKWNIRIMKGAN